ncbi:hypothetical protein WICANDRAFT_81682 [Wickerhamomyces anomalus NRRL Y-366-8]|uniref:Glucosamine 6-phosphate N-acetyltransferase n=1 Tax=Wickerhamomyces anomalus (strain ATCC 58044 / CBS 1984 / NCYC 433 / NRRL Y-366-8) TaxID=683960 RepID=A0A1E3NUT9_WICAA|nr:uncharacterized protein WICANDRAFT_81682 [Wickerhamomyces anomalus NRRL Y-366-8]ODQ56854.1 hypothetical protein WICANDRAFT_81682 [Wickerhamomyces anomalus NRRL Y-366-8]
MSSLPEGYSIRRLKATDFARGVLNTLTALTTVGDVSQLQFENVVAKWDALTLMNGSYIYNPVVIINEKDEVVATGMLFIEEKLIHNAGTVGHIEDIAVRKDQQGKSLGKLLIKKLLEIGDKAGVYKIILDCDPKNVGFYEKCGLNEAGVEMQIRF